MANARLRIQILVNGEERCTVGVAEYGVISIILGWINRNPNEITEEQLAEGPIDEWLKEEVIFDVGGLDESAEQSYFLSWLREELKAGDEVTIRILPAGEVDEPYGRMMTR